jgi:prolyl-tRNA editing enzyme YbaK/EbsC (Cys-tRNA(Pro) deacylase)
MDRNKNSFLSPSAQKIQVLLHNLGYECKVIEFEASTRTSTEAAMRVGCQLGQIVKSLVFRGQISSKPVLVLTSGVNYVDTQLISGYTGEIIERADTAFVRVVTGFAIGGVPPVGHAQKLETYLDEDLLQYGEIWAAAGTPNAVFKLSPEDLVRMTAGKTVRVKSWNENSEILRV